MHKKLTKYIWLTLVCALAVTVCCKKDKQGDSNQINIFSLQQDRDLGDSAVKQIQSDPKNYPLLDSVKYASAYNYLNNNIMNVIWNSGQLNHRNDFHWQVFIINNDSVLNAFCCPGGKIFVYSGIIKYLEYADELAGVLAHETSHADRRHTTDEMTKQYGVSFLLNALLGKGASNNTLANVALSLATLKYSRTNEAEADKYSVIYLYPTKYDARGAERFFQKLLAHGQSGSTPSWLSDHPDPGSRVQAITQEWQSLGGMTGDTTITADYTNFKNSLP